MDPRVIALYRDSAFSDGEICSAKLDFVYSEVCRTRSHIRLANFANVKRSGYVSTVG